MSDQELIDNELKAAESTVQEYARQIESGDYGNRWTVTDPDGNEHVVISEDAGGAVSLAQKGHNIADDDHWEAERDEFDEPTIVDNYGNEQPISEWPLEVVVKIGRPLSVLITFGGPNIEIVHDLSDGSAKLAGYWGGEKAFRYGKEYQTVLDYFTDSLYDEAPEEWK